MTANQPEHLSLTLPDSVGGERLDSVLPTLTGLSRSRLQRLLKDGRVRLNGEVCGAKPRIVGGEQVDIALDPTPVVTHTADEAVQLAVVHEDRDIFVIDKTAGAVMHTAPGNAGGTVLNGLLALDPALDKLPRAGIVHRLDKDTTGLFVVARTERAYASLTAQLQERTVSRRYRALVVGTLVAGGTVDEPIGRHPTDRKRMAVRGGGREAITHYRVLQRFAHHTLLDVKLETGRTHQIRVHMAHRRLPLVGDPVYGGRLRVPPGASDALIAALHGFDRQALHAAALAIIHPGDGEEREWQSPMPQDIQGLIDLLNTHAAQKP